MEKKTFRLATLGCRTNQYESEAYRNQLLGLGLREAQEGEKAELCIINTCTVTKSADSHSRRQIREFARDNHGAEIVVTGCLAERSPDSLLSIKGITKIVSNLKKEELVQELFPEAEIPEFSIKNFDCHTRAFVKVQDGCNSYCTYCIIPYVRGRSRSRTIESVVAEVKELVSSGYKEVVVTGINVGDFDGGGGYTLADLMKELDKIEGLHRLRLSSIDPDEINAELAEVILNGKITCHSLHIVLQAGSNVTLKRMNRKYSRQVFSETVDKLLSVDPAFTFTTDVIVGFPGESDLDFEETLDVMRLVKFAKVHMFPYSPRERTRAALYPNRVPDPIIKERKQKVLHLAEEMAFQLRETHLHTKAKILTESIDAAFPDKIFGHTENFLPVYLPKFDFKPNQIIDVKLVENRPEGFLGQVLQ